MTMDGKVVGCMCRETPLAYFCSGTINLSWIKNMFIICLIRCVVRIYDITPRMKSTHIPTARPPHLTAQYVSTVVYLHSKTPVLIN